MIQGRGGFPAIIRCPANAHSPYWTCRSDIIRLTSVELLSNLIWVAVTLVLWGWWFTHKGRERRRSLLPGIAAQFIALLMLTAILLPVISVSDDLQACHNPAEVERGAGKSDHYLSFHQAPHRVPVTLAAVLCCFRPCYPHALAWHTLQEAQPSQPSAPMRILWSRPPPAV